MKINVSVEVFFFTATVGVTDNFNWWAAVTFSFLTTIPYPTPLTDIINLIIFLTFPLFGFYSGEKVTDKNFWSELILVGEKYWSPP